VTTAAAAPLDDIVKLARAIPGLPSYRAALACRDLVRLEAPYVVARIGSEDAKRKYEQYLKTYRRPEPRQRFTDHNYARRIEAVLDIVREPRTQSILDAACGNGFEAVLFALHGKTVRANDCAPERIEVAKARVEFYRELLGGLSVEVSLTNIMSASAALDQYDFVYVQEAISHIHPAERFLQLCATRFLNPGGRLAVNDSNHWNPVTRVRISRHLWATHKTLRYYTVEMVDPETGQTFEMAEERLFSPLGMAAMMRKAGLTVEAVHTAGFLPQSLVHKRGASVHRTIDSAISHTPLVRWLGGFYIAVGRRD